MKKRSPAIADGLESDTLTWYEPMNRVELTKAALEAIFPVEEQEQGQSDQVAADESVESEQPIERLPGVIATPYEKNGCHLDVLCKPSQVVDIAVILDENDFFLESIAGVDWLKKEQLEIVYDYVRYDHDQCRVMVRTSVPRSKPEVPTISLVIPGANWHERETFDFYGIIFEGHPDLTRILLPEDADFFPLLKDYMP